MSMSRSALRGEIQRVLNRAADAVLFEFEDIDKSLAQRGYHAVKEIMRQELAALAEPTSADSQGEM